jgi:hypothetical protein
MGNSHGPAGHNALHGNATQVPGVTSTEEKPGSPLPEEDIPPPTGSGDKSVLQAKLTNLAIQIGYGGKDVFTSSAYIIKLYGRNLLKFIISQSVCSWQAFLALFNVCG